MTLKIWKNLKAGNCAISDNCYIDPSGGITVGEGTVIARDVVIYLHEHNFKSLTDWQHDVKIHELTIGKNCFIGAKTVILYGCSKIADGVVIGACSLVRKDIDDPNTIWAGNPLKKIGERE